MPASFPSRAVLSASDARPADAVNMRERVRPIADAHGAAAASQEPARDAILVVDANRNVRLANAAARDMCGRSPESVSQLAASLGLHEAALPLFCTAVEEHDLELPDGRWVQVSAYPTEGSGRADVSEQGSSIVVLRDVTRSRETAQAQEAFVGVLSHELRTPVTSIFGYAKMLRRPGLREPSTEMLEGIEAEAERLYRIVEDLLALSRVQAGFSVECEPLLLQHVIRPLLTAEAPRWPQVTIELQLPRDLPTVYGERTHVEQVLRNLVSNAATCSPAGTTVTITGRSSEREVEILVLDRRLGNQTAEANRLFRLSCRSHNAARQASAAGIGLYVCHGLVQGMGGRIWAAPRQGGGSEFGFSLPVAESDGDEDQGV